MTVRAKPDTRAALGWVLLTAALAVPGVLFYSWSSRMKAEHDRGVRSRSRARAGERVFQTPPPDRLTNPITAAAPEATPSRAAPAPPAVPAAPSAVPAAEAAVAPPVPAAPEPPPQAAAAPPRDPMLSPLDRRILREEEERRLLSRQGARRPVREGPRPQPVESRLTLQGIVTGPDGVALAIVNGVTMAEGSAFDFTGVPGRVRVLRITSTGVTFEHGGRRFTKKAD